LTHGQVHPNSQGCLPSQGSTEQAVMYAEHGQEHKLARQRPREQAATRAASNSATQPRKGERLWNSSQWPQLSDAFKSLRDSQENGQDSAHNRVEREDRHEREREKGEGDVHAKSDAQTAKQKSGQNPGSKPLNEP